MPFTIDQRVTFANGRYGQYTVLAVAEGRVGIIGRYADACLIVRPEQLVPLARPLAPTLHRPLRADECELCGRRGYAHTDGCPNAEVRA